MVKIAIAGGTGQVAREVVDALVASNKHDITILTRTENPTFDIASGIRWRVVDYNDKPRLTEELRGTHTVLSFVQLLSDPDRKSQKSLIDAAIGAGVRRFAPSEYGRDIINMPWWNGKNDIREYLKKVNEEGHVLEYTLFQPGLFLEYLAYPYKTTRHLDPLQSVFDFQHCRAIVVDGHENSIMTLTSVADLAMAVAQAVDYKGVWPTTGGIRGNRLTFSQIVEIGSRVRGRPFHTEKVAIDDLEAGRLKTSMRLEAIHQAVPEDQAAALLDMVVIGILLSSLKGAWDISDEINQLFPECQWTSAEYFLAEAWKGKL